MVKQARADLKVHRGKRELKIYRKALKDRRDKTVLQKWRCVPRASFCAARAFAVACLRDDLVRASRR